MSEDLFSVLLRGVNSDLPFLATLMTFGDRLFTPRRSREAKSCLDGLFLRKKDNFYSLSITCKLIKMIRILILIFYSLCLTGCTQDKFQDYESTLDHLKLNYTQYYKIMEADDALDLYFKFYSISSGDDHKRRASLYKEGVDRFYNSDSGMIDFLLKFEESQLYNEWLFLNESPLSSSVKTSDFLTESEAALVLIDYFLKGKNQPINNRLDLDYLTYENFTLFYNEYENKSLHQIRKGYKRFIRGNK